MVSVCSASKFFFSVLTQTFVLGMKEQTVLAKAFDLILMFDDVITQGYRESVNMP